MGPGLLFAAINALLLFACLSHSHPLIDSIYSRSTILSDVLAQEYDWIIVGAGPSGIVLADRLSEYQPKSKVLLIERGNASSWESGGRDQPEWANGHRLTRFDIPGLFQTDRRANYFCNDSQILAGCVLGGGTAINAGIYFYPPAADWDENFPPGSGWQSKSMRSATLKARQRIPGTDTPSMDGKRYMTEPYDVLAKYLDNKGWKGVDANVETERKNRTYSRVPFMTLGGERGGPLGSYLITAMDRPNFHLLLNTKIARAVRRGATVFGVEIESTSGMPSNEVIYVRNGRNYQYSMGHQNPKLGRVIISSGTMNTPKILFRSAIGPKDVLAVVKQYDVPSPNAVIQNEDEWVDLPVGYNVIDHAATHLMFRHKDVVGYNHTAAWDTPVEQDKKLYLQKRSGPLASITARMSLWEEIMGDDGRVRMIQTTGRAQNSLGLIHPNNLHVTLYLGRGMSSRGRITLTSDPSLTLTLSQSPFSNLYDLSHPDTKSIAAAMTSILSGFNIANVGVGLELVSPNSTTVTAEEYLRDYPRNIDRGGNHWMGSTLMAKKSKGGVVDFKGKVYGMKNLFVYDAGVNGAAGGVTSNPTGGIVVGAERWIEIALGA